ncbi:ribulokinase [Gaiella sp.]|uniref:ribulokinase n=1 Tax=Gaiella sp. TaxID=2663207 RepID=UPI002E37C64B|nr:ribulokinase [Gaiella sp.]HEX5585094.1 ribulokinase [Gaiella sp.]
MRAGRYAVGIDFGTESGRALLVAVEDGSEIGAATYRYRNGVVDERLPTPHDDVELEPSWALQDPEDYIRTLQETVPRLVSETGVDPADVIGVGIDFTSCTMLPTLADGTPLCLLDELRAEPHAWVKLWKHHAAQPEADRINAIAAERGEPWLARYGGRYSSEWFFSKALQILDEAPEIYARADRLLEAADWVVWQLTGEETRSSCTAGYKAIWSKQHGFPGAGFFAALDPRFEHVVDEKMSRRISPIGSRAGGLSEQAAAWTGLRPGTAVAVANVDAHVSAPAATVSEPGTMVIIMGTSNCHILLGDREREVEGMCGVVEDGVVPGLFGFEAGQPAVGDLLGWFVDTCVPSGGGDVHAELEREAAKLRPGECGLLALDWWNGNRSVLVDTDLRGLLVGMTLATTAVDIYRALIEATAFGTRVIVEAFERAGVPVERIVACGGLPDRNELLMQIYADVTGHEFFVAASKQTPALGAAMFGAVAAGAENGGYDSIVDASRQMAGLRPESYRPEPSHREVYDRLYAEYVRLHDLFGRGGDDVMRTLEHIRGTA